MDAIITCLPRISKSMKEKSHYSFPFYAHSLGVPCVVHQHIETPFAWGVSMCRHIYIYISADMGQGLLFLDVLCCLSNKGEEPTIVDGSYFHVAFVQERGSSVDFSLLCILVMEFQQDLTRARPQGA